MFRDQRLRFALRAVARGFGMQAPVAVVHGVVRPQPDRYSGPIRFDLRFERMPDPPRVAVMRRRLGRGDSSASQAWCAVSEARPNRRKGLR
jgi:hypothetical protein